MSGRNKKRTPGMNQAIIKKVLCSRGPGNRVVRKGRVQIVGPAFKGFLAHAHEGKAVPTSDTDDGRRYALRLPTGAFASDSDDADGGQHTHAHTGSTCTSFRNQKCSLTGGRKNYSNKNKEKEAISLRKRQGRDIEVA